MSSEIFVCKATVIFERGGETVQVQGGATVRAGHPIMEGREDMFTPLVLDYEYEKPEPTPTVPRPRVPARR